jgi:hypothetical protein
VATEDGGPTFGELPRDPALGLLAGRERPVRDPTGALDAEMEAGG